MARWQTHRSDANAEEIVQALERVGATVECIGRPVDALVGFRGANYLLEIKTLKGGLRDSQARFFQRWMGQATVVRTVDEALEAIGAVPSLGERLVGVVSRAEAAGTDR